MATEAAAREAESAEPNQPSELDEATHGELRLLYRESARSLLFAKALQWRTVSATLVIYLTLIVFTGVISDDPDFVRVLGVVSFLVSPAAISILLIYQVWQHTELERMRAVDGQFSTAFREIRRIKSRREANIHRYLLLSFMFAAILGAHLVTYLILSSIY